MLVSVGIKNDLGSAFSSLQKLSTYILNLMVALQPNVIAISYYFSCYGIVIIKRYMQFCFMLYNYFNTLLTSS
jgi:hypothetical protein